MKLTVYFIKENKSLNIKASNDTEKYKKMIDKF